MARTREYSAEVIIKNRLGFHVRPVQRFAELAGLFEAEVAVHMKNRTVPGESVMNLMTLGGRQGDAMRIIARGHDARQCVAVLKFLAESNFFVEDDIEAGKRPLRHVSRLAHVASCFASDVKATVDGKSADAKKYRALLSLGLTPASEPEFEIHGEDAEQARAVLEHLVSHCYYVEDEMVQRSRGAS